MKYLLAALAAATTVSAHGWVDNATIGGQFYEFYHPYVDPSMGDAAPPRISRKITWNGYVLDVTSIDLQCGGRTSEGVVGSEPAPLHAPVEAGDTVNLRWTLWPDSHIGPVLTYMARCPDEGCDRWLPGDAPVFFKIHHDARYTTDKVWPNDIWAVTNLTSPANTGTNYTIPPCLSPGFYLVRHEIIALHQAYATPVQGESEGFEAGAQFYPSCHQLLVSNSNSGYDSGGKVTVIPAAEHLVSFPGAYRADEEGVFFNVWEPGNYSIPGPPVFECPE